MRGGGRGGKQYLEQLQAFAARHGRAPTARECGAGHAPTRDWSIPSYNRLCHHFGSYRKALQLAGLTPRKHGARITANQRRDRGVPVDRRERRTTKPILDPAWSVVVRSARAELTVWDNQAAERERIPDWYYPRSA
jgi:hypothetical protein